MSVLYVRRWLAAAAQAAADVRARDPLLCFGLMALCVGGGVLFAVMLWRAVRAPRRAALSHIVVKGEADCRRLLARVAAELPGRIPEAFADAAREAGAPNGLPGSNVPEVHPPLPMTDEATSVTLDVNWRWLHGKGGYTNCYTGTTWNSKLCPDPQTCAANCEVEGVDYAKTYEVTTSGKGMSLGY
eukprot:gene34132-2575_t